MVEYAYKENGVMKLKPVALSLSQSEIDEIATELLEAMQPDWENAIGVSTSQIPYTVPADGFFVAQMADDSTSTSDQKVYINDKYIGEILTKMSISGTIYWRENNFSVPVSKGDIVKITNKDSGTTFIGGYAWFVPFKTSNPVSLRPLDPHKIDTAILNHWDDITSDFSIPGSTSGAVLSSVKYNPVLQQLKLIVKKTTSTAAGTTFRLYLQYNGSEPIVFGDNTILLWNHVGPANGILAGMEYGTAVMASNKLQIDAYNRNGGNVWAANDTFRGIIWL